jgi:uncharacterized protein
MKILRRLLPLLLLLPAHAEKVATTPPPASYIDDYAAVLSSPAKSQMEALARELHDKTKAQVFVVTIKTLEGETVETFANELFRKWKIGEKKTDRGVLILFAIADHKDRIEVGYGLEPIINDAKAGDIGREMAPDLKAANYDDAINTGLRDVSKIIAADAGVTLDALSTPDTEPAPLAAPEAPAQHTPKIVIAVLILVFAGPLLLFAWLFIRAARRGTLRRSSSGGGNSFSSDSSSDSTSDGSSSDDSFSGGDGGDSGGGGASGSW